MAFNNTTTTRNHSKQATRGSLKQNNMINQYYINAKTRQQGRAEKRDQKYASMFVDTDLELVDKWQIDSNRDIKLEKSLMAELRNQEIVDSIKSLSWSEKDIPAAEDWMSDREWHRTVKGWFNRAGYGFGSIPTGCYRDDATGDTYEVGMIIKNILHGPRADILKYYICRPAYDGACMKIEGYNMIYSSHTNEFPQLALGGVVGFKDYVDVNTGEWVHEVVRLPEGPDLSVHWGKYRCAKRMMDNNINSISEASLDILHIHPVTGERLRYPEWEIAQREHFKIIEAKDITAVPSFIQDRIKKDAGASLDQLSNEGVMAMDTVENAANVCSEIDDAMDKWGRPKIELKDGYPLAWVYSGTNDIDPADIYKCFLTDGFRFDLSPQAERYWH